MARGLGAGLGLLAIAAFGSCFLGGVPTQVPRTPSPRQHVEAAQFDAPRESSTSWAAPLLSFGAALGDLAQIGCRISLLTQDGHFWSGSKAGSMFLVTGLSFSRPLK